MIQKMIKNYNGITLVELVAAIALLGVISILTYSVLFTGIKANERIMEESKLRDEADYIMTHFIEVFFTLKDSQIDRVNSFYDEPDSNGNYYIRLKTGEKIGFYNGKVLIKDEAIKLLNDDIKLGKNSKIETTLNSEGDKSINRFKITLVVESKKTDQNLELESIFDVFKVREEGE
ncbi:hypothetical protein GW534_04055 [Bacillus sp. P1(2020)]|uniref:Prepilin-type N-terminal cleavage/methylation domain-containing protein n=2 Tax=Pallidibacillus pasinlerensis TaxID=2703818 RepID=A0ABX0A6C2_9BACI|nr:hypothetical protein [Pallidibacillus pasinlerensis]